jgi:hypothetical protein
MTHSTRYNYPAVFKVVGHNTHSMALTFLDSSLGLAPTESTYLKVNITLDPLLNDTFLTTRNLTILEVTFTQGITSIDSCPLISLDSVNYFSCLQTPSKVLTFK